MEASDILLSVRQEQLMIKPDRGSELVPCATLDLDNLEQDCGKTYHCRTMRVSLEPGDMLYLPALWFAS